MLGDEGSQNGWLRIFYQQRPPEGSLKLQCWEVLHSFSPLHFASDYEEDIHIARNPGEGFGFPQRVRANLNWVS